MCFKYWTRKFLCRTGRTSWQLTWAGLYMKDGVKYLLLTHYSRISFLDLVILTFAFSIKAIHLNYYRSWVSSNFLNSFFQIQINLQYESQLSSSFYSSLYYVSTIQAINWNMYVKIAADNPQSKKELPFVMINKMNWHDLSTLHRARTGADFF